MLLIMQITQLDNGLLLKSQIIKLMFLSRFDADDIHFNYKSCNQKILVYTKTGDATIRFTPRVTNRNANNERNPTQLEIDNAFATISSFKLKDADGDDLIFTDPFGRTMVIMVRAQAFKARAKVRKMMQRQQQELRRQQESIRKQQQAIRRQEQALLKERKQIQRIRQQQQQRKAQQKRQQPCQPCQQKVQLPQIQAKVQEQSQLRPTQIGQQSCHLHKPLIQQTCSQKANQNIQKQQSCFIRSNQLKQLDRIQAQLRKQWQQSYCPQTKKFNYVN